MCEAVCVLPLLGVSCHGAGGPQDSSLKSVKVTNEQNYGVSHWLFSGLEKILLDIMLR